MYNKGIKKSNNNNKKGMIEEEWTGQLKRNELIEGSAELL